MKKRSQHICFIAFALVLWYLPVPAQEKVGKYPKVYSSLDGVEVTILTYGDKADNKALVKFNRVEHPWDGRVMLYDLVPAGRGIDYRTQVDGKTRTSIVARPAYYGNYMNMELHLPGLDKKNLNFDKEKSEKANPAVLLGEYRNQQIR